MVAMQKTHVGMVGGVAVEAFEWSRGATRVKVLTLGAVLAEVWRPDRDGHAADIVLGFDDPAAYLADKGYIGTVCGRYANRIAGAAFALDGQRVTVLPNEGRNQLHGGPDGFARRIWQAAPDADAQGLRLWLTSPDGDQGFPGQVEAEALYRLDTAGNLHITLTATTSAPTPINLIHHGYWNLAGHDAGAATGQIIRIPASHYTPVDAELIPTGVLADVTATPFDLRQPVAIGAGLAAASAQGGYDHNFCIDGADGQMRLNAAALDPASGRAIAIHSNQPGVQFYTGQHMGAFPVTGKGGKPYGRFAGYALETQGFPNAVNQPDFPPVILRPGQTYRHEMLIEFSIRDSL